MRKPTVGIFCAIEDELAPFLAAMQGTQTTTHALVACHRGTLDGVDVAALYSGVCKVNAAIAAQVLIERCGAEIVLVAGTAGAMDPALAVGDCVVATEVCHHDVAPGILTEYHPWLAQACFLPDAALLARCREGLRPVGGTRLVFGRMATGEAFVDQEGRDAILAACAPLCVDMETAAVAQVCHAFGVPFLAVRSISDTPHSSGEDAFSQNCAFAAAQACAVARQMLGLLKSRAVPEEE